MTTATTTDANVAGYLARFLDDPRMTVTGPDAGIYTVTVPDFYSQARLDEAITKTGTLVAEIVNIAGLKGQVAAQSAINRTFIALATPTNAQMIAQLKALSRQSNILMELGYKTLILP